MLFAALCIKARSSDDYELDKDKIKEREAEVAQLIVVNKYF